MLLTFYHALQNLTTPGNTLLQTFTNSHDPLIFLRFTYYVKIKLI